MKYPLGVSRLRREDTRWGCSHDGVRVAPGLRRLLERPVGSGRSEHALRLELSQVDLGDVGTRHGQFARELVRKLHRHVVDEAVDILTADIFVHQPDGAVVEVLHVEDVEHRQDGHGTFAVDPLHQDADRSWVATRKGGEDAHDGLVGLCRDTASLVRHLCTPVHVKGMPERLYKHAEPAHTATLDPKPTLRKGN